MRIGHLLPTRQDRWWTIEDRTDVRVLGEELARSYRDFARPWLEEASELDFAAEHAVDPVGRVVAAFLTGDADRAREKLINVLATAPASARMLIARAERVGAKLGLR
jgi:hypothetical protein